MGASFWTAGAQICKTVLPAGASYVGGNYVSGVAVEGDSCALIAHGGPGVGMRSSLLDVPEGHARVEGA